MDKKTDVVKKRRKQIFEAAVKVIADKGFHNATIKEIAHEAGLGKGTIYQYIRKKEDLILLIAEEGVSLLSEKIEDVSASLDSPEQKIQRIIDIKLNLIQENTTLAKAMVFEVESIKNEDFARIEEIYVENFLKVIKATIEDVLPGSCFVAEDAMILADILIAMCFLWAQSDMLKKHASNIETYKKVLSNLFLYGLTQKGKDII
jgi:AcrR family transcriptional regulator